ncbi:MAG: hypothetical protein JWM41_4955 [Gemmatimonadetes bacterium]|nr:hypothetical protein [Gemmatimonadota bacterium]
MIRRLVPLAFLAAFAAPLAAQQRGDFRWEKALPAGNEVSIHNVNGDVKVVPSTTGRVEVVGIKHGSGRNIDLIKADVQQTSRGVVICVLYDDSNSSCDDNGYHSRGDRWGRNNDWSNASMNLEVAVPANLIVSASSVSGSVSVTGAQGDVTASSVSGDVRLDRIRATSVSAHSVSGNVDVHVDELTGRGDLSFRTVSGDVTLELPKQLDADISMSTVSGGLDSDYPITLGNGRMSRRRIEARIGNGGRRLDLTTVSGDVRIRKIN